MPKVCKNFENRLRFDKVTESLKVRTFLRHSVVYGCLQAVDVTGTVEAAGNKRKSILLYQGPGVVFVTF